MKLIILVIGLLALSACQYESNVNTKENIVIIIAESFYTEPECNPYIDFENFEMKSDSVKEDLMLELY